jgi:hypothetical protein
MSVVVYMVKSQPITKGVGMFLFRSYTEKSNVKQEVELSDDLIAELNDAGLPELNSETLSSLDSESWQEIWKVIDSHAAEITISEQRAIQLELGDLVFMFRN